jgi:hypothetical protein
MPFVIRLRDGYLRSVETKPPLPLVRECDELEILSVELNPEAARALSAARASNEGSAFKNGQDW